MLLPLGFSSYSYAPAIGVNIQIFSLLYMYASTESVSLFDWTINPMVVILSLIAITPCIYFWLRVEVGSMKHIYARAFACITLTTIISSIFTLTSYSLMYMGSSFGFMNFPTICIAAYVVIPLVKKTALTLERFEEVLGDGQSVFPTLPQDWFRQNKFLAYILGLLFLVVPMGVSVYDFRDILAFVVVTNGPVQYHSPLFLVYNSPQINQFAFMVSPMILQGPVFLASLGNFIFLISIFNYHKGLDTTQRVFGKGILGLVLSYVVFQTQTWLQLSFSLLFLGYNLFVPLPFLLIIGMISLSLRGKVPIELQAWPDSTESWLERIDGTPSTPPRIEDRDIKVPITYLLTSFFRRSRSEESD
jgi:hypothetical protein